MEFLINQVFVDEWLNRVRIRKNLQPLNVENVSRRFRIDLVHAIDRWADHVGTYHLTMQPIFSDY